MDEKSRLHLQKMIKANDVEDVTDLIRELKHSHVLENDINQLLLLKGKYRNDPDKIHEQGMQDCGFLFNYYTDIYNKVRKDEIDLTILNKFLNILRRIENGEIDQHDGAFLVGTLLKELYVDSALRKAEKLNENEPEPEKPRDKIELSWKDFKNMK